VRYWCGEMRVVRGDSHVVGRLESERCRAGGGCVGKNCRNDGPNGIKMVENLPGILLA